MGRIQPVRYVVYLYSTTPNRIHTPSPWYIRTARNLGRVGYGAPNDHNLATYIKRYEESTQAGGANAHLGVDRISAARIVEQGSNHILAQYPSFKTEPINQRPRRSESVITHVFDSRADDEIPY